LNGGTPGFDIPVGRTSTNPLSIAVANSSAPITALSSSSVAVGTGAKVFTIDTSKSVFTATDKITLASTANPSNSMTGTVTSLVGTTLTLNITSVTGSGTFDDWQCTLHLPSQCSYDSNPGVLGLRTGSASADFTISDWDFRGLDACFYLQNDHKVTFSQCLFDLSNYTVSNAPFMAPRSGTPTFAVQNCTFDGAGNTINVTRCLGGKIVLCEYNDFIAWPMDWCDPNPVASITTNIRFNRVVIAGTTLDSYGLHSDGMQITEWDDGDGLNIHNNVIITLTPPASGSSVTGALNMGAITGNWSAPANVYENIFITNGATYALFLSNGAFTNSAAVTFTNNYVSGYSTGPLYNGAAVLEMLSIPELYSSVDGSVLTMSYNNGSVTTNTTHIP
jgi:hypothetical protein